MTSAVSRRPANVRMTATPLAMVLLGVVGVGLAAGVVWTSLEMRRLAEERDRQWAAAALGSVPDFTLTERSGRELGLDDLRGHIWVADFIFTHCAGPCPLMSATMAKLQDAIAHRPDVRMVSISVDPERDTPEVMSRYADRYGADPSRWLFLTGPMETITRLAVEGFKVGSIEDPILHSTRFILVDEAGAIRAYRDSAESDVVERLVDDIETLRKRRAHRAFMRP